MLRVPDRHHPEDLAPLHEEPKTFEVFAETHKWNWIMGLSNVGDVNESILKGNASDLIQISEALQEKKIVQIAEEIERRHNDPENPVKLVLITGPSSSGKSTVCKRLSVQLKACGLHPISFSTDDYFVNRVDTPKLPDGSYDFDNFDTVDHEYLQKDLVKLLNGEEVEVPEYNFVTGRRELQRQEPQAGRKVRAADRRSARSESSADREGPGQGEIQDIHKHNNFHLAGLPQLHSDERQPLAAKIREGLPQGSVHGTGVDR